MVDVYAQSSLPLLLPAVEDGMSRESWRIRQSSVELMGELLFKVGSEGWGAGRLNITHIKKTLLFHLSK